MKRFTIELTTKMKDENINLSGLFENEVIQYVEFLKYKHRDNQTLLEMINSVYCDGKFGYTGQSNNGYSFNISVFQPRIPITNFHWCNRRNESINPMAFIDSTDDSKNPDKWIKIGKYCVCSYCGSMHPEELIEAIKEHGPNIIERTDKSYKIYVRLPGINNATEGPIKYYLQHSSQEHIDKVNELLFNK